MQHACLQIVLHFSTPFMIGLLFVMNSDVFPQFA